MIGISFRKSAAEEPKNGRIYTTTVNCVNLKAPPGKSEHFLRAKVLLKDYSTPKRNSLSSLAEVKLVASPGANKREDGLENVERTKGPSPLGLCRLSQLIMDPALSRL